MMSDGALSQDEIDALLQGADDAFTGDGSAKGATLDKNTLNEVAKVITDNQVFSLSSITAKTATITNVSTNTGDVSNLQQLISGKIVEIKVGYSAPTAGNIYYYIKDADAIKIASLIMGETEAELNEKVTQVVKEAYSQMIGVSDNALGSKFGSKLSSNPIEVNILEDAFDIAASGSLLIINGSLNIEGEITGAPYVAAVEMPLLQAIAGSRKQANANNRSQAGSSNKQGGGLGIQHADFNPLMPASGIQGTSNIGLLMDVTMNLTVELGRATMTIRDILGLGEGSIIELQKLAGEPVDLLVNGKLIAKGEVVVIDENFGVRVTDIINPMDRLINKK